MRELQLGVKFAFLSTLPSRPEARLPDARLPQFIKRRCASAQLPVISK